MIEMGQTREAIAFELFKFIADYETPPNSSQDKRKREDFLSLYKECLKTVGAYDSEKLERMREEIKRDMGIFEKI